MLVEIEVLADFAPERRQEGFERDALVSDRGRFSRSYPSFALDIEGLSRFVIEGMADGEPATSIFDAVREEGDLVVR